MPGHKTHELIDQFFLGRRHPEVHKFMDSPWYQVLGPRHRKVLHDIRTPFYVYLLTGDIERTQSSILHLAFDYAIKNKKQEMLIYNLLKGMLNERKRPK